MLYTDCIYHFLCFHKNIKVKIEGEKRKHLIFCKNVKIYHLVLYQSFLNELMFGK